MATAINSTSILRTYSPDVGLADNPSLTTTANSKTGVDRDVGLVGSFANNSTFVADNAGPAAPMPTARHVMIESINSLRQDVDPPDPDLIL